ncbi:GTPase-activating protein skywalker-like [Ptychodera flava]|uniref:GTPase-activating protein skywalker-like n=1 Tax=Ptychodera flava TaxID=63121 RepID=UPI00396A1306
MTDGTEQVSFSQWVDRSKIRDLCPSVELDSRSDKVKVLLPEDVTDGKRLKNAIRNGEWPPNHTIRQRLWHEVYCSRTSHPAAAAVYVETADNTQGWQTHIPAFIDNTNIMTYALNTEGRSLVKKILCIIEHVHTDITYCPLLPAITSLLLHYMGEEECYSSLSKLLTSRQPRYLTQTRTAYQASILTLKDLAKKYAETGHQYISRKSDNDDEVYADWMWWIFKYLPFTHLVRVMDCYLVEGIKILYRVALAIIILYKKHMQGTPQGSAESNTHTSAMKNFVSNMPVTPGKLLKTSFKIKGLSRSVIYKYQQRHEVNLRKAGGGRKPPTDQDGITPLQIPDINSSIVNHSQLQTIWRWLPQRIALCKPVLLFTTEEHGSSITAMFNRCEDEEPTILLVKTTSGKVFGSYLSTRWRARQSREKDSSYFGTGECFVFSLVPEEQKYAWVGIHGETISRASSLFMRAEADSIAIGGGGGDAIYIYDGLHKGMTFRSETFNNPPLCETDFICQVVEIIGLTDTGI